MNEMADGNKKNAGESKGALRKDQIGMNEK